MPKADQTPEDRAAQLRAFQDAARELECDDDAERFDERVRKLVQTPAQSRSANATEGED